jgi:hypothetical protein
LLSLTGNDELVEYCLVEFWSNNMDVVWFLSDEEVSLVVGNPYWLANCELVTGTQKPGGIWWYPEGQFWVLTTGTQVPGI